GHVEAVDAAVPLLPGVVPGRRDLCRRGQGGIGDGVVDVATVDGGEIEFGLGGVCAGRGAGVRAFGGEAGIVASDARDVGTGGGINGDVRGPGGGRGVTGVGIDAGGRVPGGGRERV